MTGREGEGRGARLHAAYGFSLLPPLLGLYGSLYALWSLGPHWLYFRLMALLGVPAFDWPFLDAHGVFSLVQCHRLGFDILVTNPCDALGRTSSYSPLWLDIVPNALANAPVQPVGCVLGLGFLLALPLVLRPRRWSEWFCCVAAGSSSMVAFALERGQADLLLFVFAAVAALLLGGGRWARCGAYALFLFSGLLKYYPLVLLLTAARERVRPFLAIAGTTALVLAIFALYYGRQLTGALAIVPGDGPGATFGAARLPQVAAMAWGVLGLPGAPLVEALIVLCLLAALAVEVRRLLGRFRAGPPIDWTGRNGRCLVVGAALIAGCFFAGMSASYRGVHLLFILPALMALWTQQDPHWRRVFGGALAVTLFLLWSETCRGLLIDLLQESGLPETVAIATLIVFLTARELIWWWLAGFLLTLLLLFLRDTPLGAWTQPLARLQRSPFLGAIRNRALPPPM